MEEPDVDADEQRARENDDMLDEAYKIFKASFESDQKRELASSVTMRANRVLPEVRLDIDFAKSAYETMKHNYEETHTGWMNPLVTTILRSYRAIEWFQGQLGEAVFEGLLRPFSHYPKAGAKAVRDVLRSAFMRGLRDAVIDEAFRSGRFAGRLTQYLDDRRGVRNEVAHSPYTPTGPEAFTCLTGAIEIYNDIDKHLNPIRSTAIEFPIEVAG